MFNLIFRDDFNSIKVQLERTLRRWARTQPRFQFHKGTIRTGHPPRFCYRLHHFNSIKVQLEPWQVLSIKKIIIFQFHKGTIRTICINILLNHLILFQFHKGTIRTFCGLRCALNNKHFNSIKVQLEPTLTAIRFLMSRFQFHKGTIRTSAWAKDIRLIVISIP